MPLTIGTLSKDILMTSSGLSGWLLVLLLLSSLWRYQGVTALSIGTAPLTAAVVYSCAGFVWVWYREDAAGTGKEMFRWGRQWIKGALNSFDALRV